MKLSKYEQETIVLYNAEDKNAEIYTADRTVMRKLDKLCEEHPDIYKTIKSDELSKTYSVPKNYINYRKPRTLTSEQVEIIRERMRKLKSQIN